MLLRQIYYLQTVLRNQWKSPQELERLQEKRLRHLLHHAYTNTSFYHQKFKEAHIHPSDFEKLDDIVKFPITTKEELRKNYPHNTISRGFDLSEGIEMSTSGSTGKMLTFFCSYATFDYHMAMSYRNISVLGYKPWEKLAYTRFHPLEIEKEDLWYQKLGLMRCIHIDVFKPLQDQVGLMRQHNPEAVTGYPSILLEWAKMVEKDGKDTITPHFIRTEAEMLTSEARAYMEKIFGCGLYEEYGSSEMVHYAFQCRERSYHISVDNAVMEFLDDGEPVADGEEGEIITTGLATYGMPFIRYSLLDRGVPMEGACPCGRGLPLMKLVVGRDDDFMVLPSGRRIGPRMVVPLFELVKEIAEYRVVQEKKDLITLDIVKGKTYTQDTEDRLRKTFLYVLAEPVDIIFNYTDTIPRGRHNRPRPLVSKVSS